jgi:hypothetical protein
MAYVTLKEKLKNLKTGQKLPTSILFDEDLTNFRKPFLSIFQKFLDLKIKIEDVELKYAGHVESTTYNLEIIPKTNDHFEPFKEKIHFSLFWKRENDWRDFWIKNHFPLLTPGELAYTPYNYTCGYKTFKELVKKNIRDIPACITNEGDVVMILETHEYVYFIKYLYQDKICWTDCLLFSKTWCDIYDNNNHKI